MKPERIITFDAQRLQADWDSQGLFAKIRTIRRYALARGDADWIAGTTLLLSVAALAPFIAAVLP